LGQDTSPHKPPFPPTFRHQRPCRRRRNSINTSKAAPEPAPIRSVRFWTDRLDSNWGCELYTQHLKAFNNFDEGDGSGKSGLDAFLNTFHAILQSFQETGFDEARSLVPVTGSGIVIDGAHRVAAAVCHDRNVSIVPLNTSGFVFDYHFFQSRGLQSRYMDAVALEYCRLKPTAYVVLIFPTAAGHGDRVVEILSTHGQIFYEKKVFLNRLGALNLIRNIYDDHSWIGDQRTRFAGARSKANACFARKAAVRVFVYDCDSLANVNAAKREIRHLFNVGNHSIHINDSNAQALQIAQLLMNDNSIHYLNNATSCALPKFEHDFESFRRWLISQRLKSESFCVDGGAVLGAYGLREPRDLDVLEHGQTLIDAGVPGTMMHPHEVSDHAYTTDDLIFNPQNHFYYKGIKFVSLRALQKMKSKRAEPKDKRDVRMISRCLTSNKSLVLVKIAYEVERSLRRVKRRLNHEAFRAIGSALRGLSAFSSAKHGA
jgi:hypothetical protein